jgi:hypothetical protein
MPQMLGTPVPGGAVIGILLPTQSLKVSAFCAKFSGANVNIVNTFKSCSSIRNLFLWVHLIWKVKVQIIQIGCDNIKPIIGYGSESIYSSPIKSSRSYSNKRSFLLSFCGAKQAILP